MHPRNGIAFDQTQQFWQRRTGRTLTTEDAREIQENLLGLVRTLLDWRRSAGEIESSAPATARHGLTSSTQDSGTHAGSVAPERAAKLRDPRVRSTHAHTSAAPANDVDPDVLQVGHGKEVRS